MVHQGQGLTLGLEAGKHLARVHAFLDKLEGDAPLDRFDLLGHPDGTHAASASVDPLQKFVAIDPVIRLFGCPDVEGSSSGSRDYSLPASDDPTNRIDFSTTSAATNRAVGDTTICISHGRMPAAMGLAEFVRRRFGGGKNAI
jgi:hypothetical protein